MIFSIAGRANIRILAPPPLDSAVTAGRHTDYSAALPTVGGVTGEIVIGWQ